MDFFTVEVMTLFGLVRYHVLFAIDIGSRVVEIAGIGRDPDGRWMMQRVRREGIRELRSAPCAGKLCT